MKQVVTSIRLSIDLNECSTWLKTVGSALQSFGQIVIWEINSDIFPIYKSFVHFRSRNSSLWLIEKTRVDNPLSFSINFESSTNSWSFAKRLISIAGKFKSLNWLKSKNEFSFRTDLQSKGNLFLSWSRRIRSDSIGSESQNLFDRKEKTFFLAHRNTKSAKSLVKHFVFVLFSDAIPFHVKNLIGFAGEVRCSIDERKFDVRSFRFSDSVCERFVERRFSTNRQ